MSTIAPNNHAQGIAATRTGRPTRARVIQRHGAATRLWHWVNFACLVILLMSGLQIFNAHPALYWGSGSDFSHPLLAIGAMRGADGQPTGVTRIAGHGFNTTGVLGLSTYNGQPTQRAFPSWATLPGPQWLAMGRQWHITFAWIFVAFLASYLAYSLISAKRRHLLRCNRDMIRSLPRTVIDHALLRFHHVRDYNPLQKLTYLFVLFILLPLMVATGLSLSPTIDAAWSWLPALFGGHQSARTIHFICAFLLLGFFVIHILLVLVSGVFNNLRSMTTGGYRIEPEDTGARHRG